MLLEFGDQNVEMKPERLAVIDIANHFIDDMQQQKYTVTLRQLYYLLVKANHIPNNFRSYKNFGTLMGQGRLRGLISWDAIEDRHRTIEKIPCNEDPTKAMEDIEWRMIIDAWARQPHYIETWVEKDAQVEIVGRACNKRRVPYMACKGYLSLTEGYRAGQRFEEAFERGQKCVLLYLGDHDPSGMNMVEVNARQLAMFSHAEAYGETIEVRQLALTRDQVDLYRCPPQPAKTTDSRGAAYIAEHGKASWELDALHPSVVNDLIDDAINDYFDEDAWDQAMDDERDMQADLVKLRQNWPSVKTFLDTL